MTQGPKRPEPAAHVQERSGPAPPRPGEPAPDAAVRDETGADLWLHDVWARTPRGLALVFVRHFGDQFCRAHVALLRDRQERLHEEGVRPVVVAAGTPEQCARFRRRNALPFPVLADPQRDAYRAYGLIDGAAPQTLGMPEIAGRIRLALRGILPGRAIGAAGQRAADFLIDRDGVLRYARHSRRPSDIPPPDELLAAAHELL